MFRFKFETKTVVSMDHIYTYDATTGIATLVSHPEHRLDRYGEFLCRCNHSKISATLRKAIISHHKTTYADQIAEYTKIGVAIIWPHHFQHNFRFNSSSAYCHVAGRKVTLIFRKNKITRFIDDDVEDLIDEIIKDKTTIVALRDELAAMGAAHLNTT
jgi:hypothetical protein